MIDSGDAGLTWKWYRASSSFGAVDRGPRGNSPNDLYNVEDTAGDTDEGMYLRAVATYTDRRGSRNTAEFISQNPVQNAREDNTSPVFAGDQSRNLDENSTASVGAAVTATDVDGDILTYSIDGSGRQSHSPHCPGHWPVEGQNPQGLNYEVAARLWLTMRM